MLLLPVAIFLFVGDLASLGKHLKLPKLETSLLFTFRMIFRRGAWLGSVDALSGPIPALAARKLRHAFDERTCHGPHE